MKLSTNQLHALQCVAYANICEDRGAYMECGNCKPFSVNTIKSLIKRDMITVQGETRYRDLYNGVWLTPRGLTVVTDTLTNHMTSNLKV